MRALPELAALFEQKWHRSATLHAIAPGRINLIGEHVDYLGGHVVPAAIDLGVSVLFAPDESRKLKIRADDLDSEGTWDKNGLREANESWRRYIDGCLKELEAIGVPAPSGRALIASDLPTGAGLSSSAALEVAVLLMCLHAAAGQSLDSRELALMAQRVENKHVGTQCGIMDQFASVHGKQGQFMVLDCESLEVRYVNGAPEGCTWLLVNSMVSHELGGQYNEIRRDLESGEHKLGLGPLKSLEPDTLEQAVSAAGLSPTETRRTRYAVGEMARTRSFITALENGEGATAGTLLQETHWGLSRDLGVSTRELDALVTSAAKVPGWLGGRMMGGGFGGCTLNLIETRSIDAFKQRVTTDFEHRFDLSPDMYPVKLESGACCIAIHGEQQKAR